MPFQKQGLGGAFEAAVAGEEDELVWKRAEVIKFLVEKEADVNMPFRNEVIGGAAEVAAAYLGQTEIVTFLVQHGAVVNMPLQTAGRETEIVKFLVRHGAGVNIPPQTGGFDGALAAAASWGWKRRVESLIDAGVKVNCGFTLNTGHHHVPDVSAIVFLSE
ncbi:hypothetical protein B0O99DRAFT_600401 [Bisporella sp. PMI_857]|nr:hypothetical protein B0O99DRAFT_600401 [Bisporella sp. PMI_857]